MTARDKPLALLSAQAPRATVPLPCQGAGFTAPPGKCPAGQAVRELFLGLTQAAALGTWGVHRHSPALGKETLLPAVGGGNGVSQGGGHPRGHTVLVVWHLAAPHPAPSRLPMHCRAAREPWVPLEVSLSTRNFYKAPKWENNEAGEVSAAPALRSLAPLPAKTRPKSFPAGLHPDPEWGAPRHARHSQPSRDHKEPRQGWQGDTAAAASTGGAAAPMSCSTHEL